MNIVPPDQLANVWPHVRDWIVAAIEKGLGDENELDVLIALARGQYTLWYEPEHGALITQIQQYPRQKILALLYAGAPVGSGTVERLKVLLERERATLKNAGITQLRMYGQRDWGRVLNVESTYVTQVAL